MKSWLIGAAIGLCVVGIYLFFFHRPTAITNFPPHEGPVVAFGDSLTAGSGSTDGNDYVSLLSQKIGEPIQNFGVPGDTTMDALARIDQVIATHPRIVLVLLGGNDYLKRVPIDTTFENLQQIIGKLQADDTVVVLIGIRGGVLQDNYAGRFESLGRKTGSLYIPNALDGILGHQNLMFDEIHPNNAGYAIIAQKIYDAIKPLLTP